MLFLLHVEWPKMPPYKLLLTYYVWRMFEWHIPSCLEGHFLGIRRGVEIFWEQVTFFITFTNVFYFCHVFTFLTLFKFLFERLLHLWINHSVNFCERRRKHFVASAVIAAFRRAIARLALNNSTSRLAIRVRRLSNEELSANELWYQLFHFCSASFCRGQ